MELIADIQKFYTKHNVKNHIDHRIEEEKAKQGEIVRKICRMNLDVMKIQLGEKKSVKYAPRPMQRIDLEEGVYCYVTDNEVKSEQTVMTFHGLPGSCNDWASIEAEMKDQVRWVNFAIPGIDGEDERRGSYAGDYPALLDLIIKVKNKLKIKRIIACGHSYGTTIAFNLKEKFPEEVEGYVNIGGLSNYWSFGLTMVYRACVAEFKYYDEEWKSKKLFNIDEERQKIYQRYFAFYNKHNYAKHSMPFYRKNELLAYIKLTCYPIEYQDNVYNRYKKLPGLRLVVYGKNDPLHLPEMIQSTLHFIMRQEQSYINRLEYRKLFEAAKLPLEARLRERFGVEVEGGKIQDYFCFILEQTGHAIHRRRPEELAKLITVYAAALQVLHQQTQLLQSKL